VTVAYIFIFHINYLLWAEYEEKRRKGGFVGNVSVWERERDNYGGVSSLFGSDGICGDFLFNTYCSFYAIILLISHKYFHISTHLFVIWEVLSFGRILRMWMFRVVVVVKVFGQYWHLG